MCKTEDDTCKDPDDLKIVMIFFLLALLLIIAGGLRFSKINQFNEDYLNKKNTTAVNGIFVVLIVFSHYSKYVDFGGVFDAPYLAMRAHLDQMVVASFLFYSGFGMMESIKKKGLKYIDRLFVKFWRLLFKFDIAVLLFLIVDIAFDIRYPVRQILLAFTTWTAIGNSNWYITAILMIYAAIMIAFRISYDVFKERAETAGLLITVILTIGFIYLQMVLDRRAYCYNTMILAPLGMLYSEYRYTFERLIMRNDINYYMTAALTIVVYIVSFRHRWQFGIEGYTVWAVAFTALLVIITMKVRIYNKVLEWLGTHVFSIYILQRIPMIILSQLGFIEAHKYIGLLIVFSLTLPFAVLYEKVTDILLKSMQMKKLPAA